MKHAAIKCVISGLLVCVLTAGLLSGCKTTPGTDKIDPTDEPATEIVTTAPTPEVTAAPTEKPTPTPDPTPTPEPTEKPDYSGGITSDKPRSYSFFGRKGQAAYCGTGHRLAVQFYATTEFVELGFHSPTWTATSGYYVDYELYSWDKDYDTTVYEHEPIATGHFEDWQDGVMVGLKVDNLPAGEYVLLALYGSTQEMCNGGVWHDTDVEREDQVSYLDDDIWYDHVIWFEIKYARTPANKYGPLSDSGL